VHGERIAQRCDRIYPRQISAYKQHLNLKVFDAFCFFVECVWLNVGWKTGGFLFQNHRDFKQRFRK
jgi:hypothetical protein